ncbi:uncharacterized protein [Medicago truncatula]|uniref:Uncharacterized protein n=2 Tax=Medicago truncatula TaxID=3880 RepID=G7JXR4_MEDTR|nr:uncharacterized protein LOC11407365 [Medicago truncatula]AES96049.1 hypothetical protein MTR_5g032580 [Medicago truncatula]
MDHHGIYTKDMSNKNVLEVPVSAEELKIRSELAMMIERDLEEEIKEGLYNLARRLLRIFQQRKERDAKDAAFVKVDNKIRALSEVIIRMRMEGGTKIEIKEVNKEANKKGCAFTPNFRPKKCLKEVKKIDWEKSLRAGSSPVPVKGSYVRSKQKDKIMMRGKNASEDKKLLQLVWKV